MRRLPSDRDEQVTYAVGAQGWAVTCPRSTK